jgi:hypothetical protein|tara:strand:- start:50 stop:1549 length:1500 start_codon:yes stop_codon:yes gene_type:complete
MIERFKNIFTGLERAHGVTIVEDTNGNGSKVKGKSFVKRQPVTDELWKKHLEGKDNLGIIPINDDNECKWGCIDIDSYAGFDHAKLVNKINQLSLPLLVCRSKSGGAHVFLFTFDYVSAKLMRDKLVQIRAVLGYGNSEVFPKQTELKSQDDTGNFLNLPYFNSLNSVRYAFNSQGKAVSLLGFYELHDKIKITSQQLQELQIKRPESEFNDGPPCIEALTQNKLDDGRDRIMYQYIIYAKKKWPNNWQDKLFEFNYKYFSTPLDQKTILGKIKNNEKNDFHYKCNEEPMCNVCDKKLCKSRKYGIGEEVSFPNLTDLQVIDLEDPYYYLNVDGERLKLESVKHLRQQSLFQEACMVQLKNRPPSLKEKDWVHITNILLNNAEVTEPAEGLRTEDQLYNHLREYCLNRTQLDSKDDLPRGGTWTNNGYHHFVFDKFYHNHLMRKRWDLGYSRTAEMLREKCGCTDKRIGKNKLSVYVVEEFEKKTEEYKQKKLKEETPY